MSITRKGFVEPKVISEDSDVRVFLTEGNAAGVSHYSDSMRTHVPVTVALDSRSGRITIACTNGAVNVRDIVKDLWGPNAVGYDNIGYSPDDRQMALSDLEDVAEKVKASFGVKYRAMQDAFDESNSEDDFNRLLDNDGFNGGDASHLYDMCIMGDFKRASDLAQGEGWLS